VRWERAPAKVNLTLRVLGRRLDGLHEIESLVAFAGICDWLGFQPSDSLALEVDGPTRDQAGSLEDNLVLVAARALARHVPGLILGRFRLIKRLPAAAGLGGGSSDAAAALRALAETNGLSLDDERVREAALATGADVPVCLRPKARVMRGVGEKLGPPVTLPGAVALLVNPRVAAPTGKVFAQLELKPGAPFELGARSATFDLSGPLTLEKLALARNDLETGAIKVAPEVSVALASLLRLDAVKTARISGSGATCFALFDNRRSAALARRAIAAERPGWWVKTTTLR
jgi:4-diphosphocytidyl-2-C-methyl-D-erythritol kinase